MQFRSLLVFYVASTATAFAPLSSRAASTGSRLSLSSDAANNVEALRAAAAKAREEAARLSQELGKTTTTQTESPVAPKKTPDEVQSLLPQILATTELSKQTELWQDLKSSNSLTKFASADLRTYPVSLGTLEQRTGLNNEKLGLNDNAVSLDDFKYATLYVTAFSSIAAVASLALLPQNIGSTLCYLFALLPILFLGIGSTAPGIIANAIAGLRNGSTGDAQERMVQHEAAHFCVGYWCGLPIAGYSTQEGVAKVDFNVASSSNSYSNTEVAALCATGLAGLVGEAMTFESARGGTQDLETVNQVFRSSQEFIGAAAQQDLTRWGALSANLLLLQNKPQYEKVVEAFRRQAPLEECIAILES